MLANPTGAPGDMIELANTTSQPINIGGWFLSNSSSNLTKYEIPAGATLAAKGYYVLTQDNNFGFTLDPDGGAVHLSNNYDGQAGGYQESQSVPAMLPGYSYGLYAKSNGAANFTLLQTPAFGTLSGTTYSGAANSIPYVSPLATDEIMYDPSQPTTTEAADGYVDNDFEYAELYNRSSSPVTLSDYYVGGGIGYTPGWLADGSLANDFTVAGITLSGTTATVTLDNTSSGFQNGDEIHIAGAAQSQYDGDFTIANVTVKPSAGTTTFTYAVSGSPASPATPLSGQTLTAGKDSEFETLESGATATWSASNVAAGSYTVYAHLNLYDGDNNPLDLDASGPVHGHLRRCTHDRVGRPGPGPYDAQCHQPDLQQLRGLGDGGRQQLDHQQQLAAGREHCPHSPARHRRSTTARSSCKARQRRRSPTRWPVG